MDMLPPSQEDPLRDAQRPLAAARLHTDAGSVSGMYTEKLAVLPERL